MPHSATGPGLSPDAIARQLSSRFGTTPERARDLAHRLARQSLAPEPAPELPPTVTPVRFDIPWPLLVSDNRRASITQGVRLWRTYAQRKAGLAAHAQRCIATAPLGGPVVLCATAHAPSRRRFDVGNFRKAVTDALNGIAYADDSQLVLEIWHRADVDRDRPRLDVVLWRLNDAMPWLPSLLDSLAPVP